MFANALLMHLEWSKLKALSIHVFFSTWLVYQWSRKMYWEKIKNKTIKDDIYYFQQKHIKLTNYSILFSAIMAFITFIFLQRQTKILLVALGSLSMLYTLPLNKMGISFRLRDVPFIKLFLIALAWATTCTFLPALESKNLFVFLDYLTWNYFVAQFIFILFITLPFDIHDINTDKQQLLKTIPNSIGIKNTKLLLVALLCVYVYWVAFLPIKENLKLAITLLNLALLFCSIRYIHQLNKTKIMLIYDGSLIAYFFVVAISFLLK